VDVVAVQAGSKSADGGKKKSKPRRRSKAVGKLLTKASYDGDGAGSLVSLGSFRFASVLSGTGPQLTTSCGTWRVTPYIPTWFAGKHFPSEDGEQSE
jgi:hypothetical protein